MICRTRWPARILCCPEHDYSVDKPIWTELTPGHYVFGNNRELDGYREQMAKQGK